MTRTPPPLPAEISANGAELWDWAADFSGHVHRQAKRRDLDARIREAQRQCGSCRMWMTRSCPREFHERGRTRGPSMKAPKCGRFEMQPRTRDLIEKLREEILALAREDQA